jgi:hypothetical protein
MELEELPIDWSQIKIPRPVYPTVAEAPAMAQGDRTLDDLIHSNTRILRTKVETVASAIGERLKIRQQNIGRIADDKDKLSEMLQKITVGTNYHLRDHREKGPFYQRMFDLEQERRDQDTGCWRDIVLVLRDFLTFWDEYERAKARGAFLEDVR